MGNIPKGEAPIIPYHAPGFEDLNHYWFEYLHLAEPESTREVRDYLSGLAQEIITSNKLDIPLPRILLSDKDEPNACVLEHQGDGNVVVFMRGMFSFAQSEDELMGVMGHELAHIFIKRKTQRQHNSRPEEAGADGLAGLWLVGTGRNWHAFQQSFQRPVGEAESKDFHSNEIFRKIHNFLEVHSQAPERVQNIETAIGGKILRDKVAIPEPEPKPIPPEILAKAQAIRHEGHIERQIRASCGESLSPVDQVEALVGLDRVHREGGFVSSSYIEEQRYSDDADIITGIRDLHLYWSAMDERRQDYDRLMLESLKKITPEASAPQLTSLINRAVDQTGLVFDRNTRTGEYVVPTLNLENYMAAHDVLYPHDSILHPMGTVLGELADAARRLIAAQGCDEALQQATAFVAVSDRMKPTPSRIEDARFNLYGEWYRPPKDLVDHLYFFRKLDLPAFTAQDGDVLPWANHVEWAKQDESGAITKALWRMGVNSDEKLWAAIPLQSRLQYAEAWNMTQPKGELSAYAFTPKAFLQAIEEGVTSADILKRLEQKRDNPENNEQGEEDEDNPGKYAHDWVIADYERHLQFKNFAAYTVGVYRATCELPLPEFRAGHLREDMRSYFNEHDDLLRAPMKRTWSGRPIDTAATPIVSDEKHFERTGILFDALDRCLGHGHPDDRAAVRDFVLREAPGPSKEPYIKGITGWLSATYPWDSPFIRFITDDKYRLLSPHEMLYVLIDNSPWGAHSLSMGSATPADKARYLDHLPQFRKMLGYQEPQSLADITALPDFLGMPHDPWSLIKRERQSLGQADAATPVEVRMRGSMECKYILYNMELVACIGRTRTPVMSEAFADFCQQHEQRIGPYTECMSSSRHEMRELLAGMLEPDDLVVPTTLSTPGLIEIYKTLDRSSALPNTESLFAMGDTVLARIASEADTGRRLQLYEQLCFADQDVNPDEERTMRDLSDFILAEKAIRLWAADAGSQIGMDDGSPEYLAQKAIPVLDRISSRCPEREQYIAYRCLADAILAQGPVCSAIEQKLDLDKDMLGRLDVPMRGVEELLDSVHDSPQSRKNCLQYIMGPVDSPMRDVLVDSSMQFMDGPDNRSGPSVRRVFCMRTGIITHDQYFTIRNDDPLLRAPETNEKMRAAIGEQYVQMHWFFWSRSAEVRAVAINKLIIPAKDLSENREAALVEAARLTLDCLFDKTPASADEAVRQRWGRAFLDVYLEQSQESERGLMMGALISATHAVGPNREQASFGERFATMLTLMGPAFKKLGQAIHSYPSTPEDIRQPFARTKRLNEKQSRWKLFKRINSAVPSSIREGSWVGDIEGDASFFTVVPVKLKNGDMKMLGLLAENARHDATDGYNRMENCTKILAEREPEFEPISRAFLAMIRQARELVDVETDMHLGARQSQIMQSQYQGLQVVADGQKFNFSPMPWHCYGDNFKLMDIAQGVHFDQLPEQTPLQKDFKHAAAKAISAVGFWRVLSGTHLDHDWHEGQIRINGNTLGMFDPGGIGLTAPGKLERQQLGQTLGKLLPKLMPGGKAAMDLPHLLVNHLARLEEQTGSCPPHLIKVETALLAQNGFHRHLVASDFNDIGKTMILDRLIAPDIALPFIFTALAGKRGGGILKAVRQVMGANKLQISQDKKSLPPAPLYMESKP